jgi:P27 family predicted phage terminase small subunit
MPLHEFQANWPQPARIVPDARRVSTCEAGSRFRLKSGRSAAGSTGPRKALVAPVAAAPDPADDLPPPGWLSPRECMLWIELVADAPWLRPLDTALLAALCVARDLHRQAAEAVSEQGMVVTGSDGVERPHPAIRVLSQQAALALRLSEALGMTPSARERLGIKGGEPLRQYDEDGQPMETLEEYLARDPTPKLH